MAESEAPSALRAAVGLFNEQQYLAAHELLEELWEATHDASSDFYQGLIQACICMHHRSKGNLEGARKLHAGHRRLLAAYLPAHLGVDVAGLLEAMQAARARGADEVVPRIVWTR